jgi:hypothetical protein
VAGGAVTKRTIWARAYAGTWRGTSWSYWTTDATVLPGFLSTAVPSGATIVPLMLDSAPSCSGGVIEPLSTMAADSTLTLSFAASAAAIAVCAPDLAIAGSARRVGYLDDYVDETATTIPFVEEQTVAPGDVLYIAGELVEVDTVGTGSIDVFRGVLDTWARSHSSPLADPAVAMDARRVPLRGQILEYGVTDGGVDTVIWRGIVSGCSLSASQGITLTATSMLSLLRQTLPIVPRGAIPLWVPSTDLGEFIGFLSWLPDDREYPRGKWEYVRVIGKSGDWAIIDLDTLTFGTIYEGDDRRVGLVPPDFGAPIIGSADGVVRVATTGATVRVRAAAGVVTRRITSWDEAAIIRREHALAVLGELASLEWADVDSSLYCATVAQRLIVGTGLPARMSTQIPASWVQTLTVAAGQMRYASASTDAQIIPIIGPDGSLADWIASSLLRPGGLMMGCDLGLMLIDTWAETTRAVLGVELTAASQDDRGSWSWSQTARPLLGVQFDDPTSDVEQVRAYALVAGPRSSLAIRGKLTARTVTTGSTVIISADAWLSGQRGIETVPAPLGVSAMQLDAWQSLVSTYGRDVPSIGSPVREALGVVFGSAITVALPDGPTTRTLIGRVY